MKKADYRDLYFLLPLAAAVLVAFLRFPLLQVDDNLSVIRHIAETGRWPEVTGARFAGVGLRQAGHAMLHHTLAAGIWRALEVAGASLRTTARGAQALSAAWALGTAALIWCLLNRLGLERAPRRLALFSLGTFAGWIWTGAAVGNDMALAFWSTVALAAGTAVISSPPPLRWKPVLFLCLGVGLAAASKDLSLLILPGALAAVLARKIFYRESLARLAAKALAVAAAWGLLTSVNAYRHWQGTGTLFHYQDLRISQGLDVSLPVPRVREKSFFSFRFDRLLRRPYALKEKERVFLSPEDYLAGDDYASDWDYNPDSVWTDLYATWWSLPDHIPQKPDPAAARLLYIAALPVSLLGLLGAVLALAHLGRPLYWPTVCWALGAVALLLGVSYLVEVPFSHARLFSFAVGSGVVFLALGFRTLLRWKPALEPWLWVYLSALTAVFWYLLLAGPFYSFWPVWPRLTPA